MIVSGPLPAHPNLRNFHFELSDSKIVFKPPSVTEVKHGDRSAAAASSSKCLDGNGDAQQVVLAECTGAPSQQWSHDTNGQLRQLGSALCMGWV